MNITKNETYDYRNGNPARVICVDSPDTDYPVISIDSTGFPLSHTSTGEFLQGQKHPDDLVIRVPDCPVTTEEAGDPCMQHLLDALEEITLNVGRSGSTARRALDKHRELMDDRQ